MRSTLLAYSSMKITQLAKNSALKLKSNTTLNLDGKGGGVALEGKSAVVQTFGQRGCGMELMGSSVARVMLLLVTCKKWKKNTLL